MLYLLLSILSAVAIANLLQLFQRDKNSSILLILLSNYFIASLFSIVVNKTPLSQSSPFTIIMGIAVGALYFINFLTYNKNIRENGISISVGVMRMSLVIPILLSLFLFRESISLFNYFGIAVILISFGFMGKVSKSTHLWLLVFLFVVTGISESGMKIFKQYSGNSEELYLFFLFGSAFILNLGAVIAKKTKIHYRSLLYGLLLGIPNQLTSLFFMKSLDTVPAAIAYPLLGSSVVLFSIISDVLIWRSKFTIKQRLIFLLIVIGIVLINLK